MNNITDDLLRKAMDNKHDKEIIIRDPNEEVYTANENDLEKVHTATENDLKTIINFFENQTTRIIYKEENDDKIDTSKTYEVRKDKDGNEFILLYFINQTRPVKCMKYKKGTEYEKGTTGFAYNIAEDGTAYIGFYKKGEIQHVKFCKINIKEKKRKRKKMPAFDENPISYKQSTEQDEGNKTLYESDHDDLY